MSSCNSGYRLIHQPSHCQIDMALLVNHTEHYGHSSDRITNSKETENETNGNMHREYATTHFLFDFWFSSTYFGTIFLLRSEISQSKALHSHHTP